MQRTLVERTSGSSENVMMNIHVKSSYDVHKISELGTYVSNVAYRLPVIFL